jgi:hypothetical protein
MRCRGKVAGFSWVKVQFYREVKNYPLSRMSLERSAKEGDSPVDEK